MYTGTCLKLHMNFVIQGYTEIWRDRSVGNGGGLPNLSLVLEVWAGTQCIRVVNFYNPYEKLRMLAINTSMN